MGGWWRDDARGSAGEPCFQRLLDLARLGEAVAGLLREQHLAVELHLEDAAPALDQLGRLPEPLLDLGRQTGGAGVVVSGDAVFDRDPLGHPVSFSRPIIEAAIRSPAGGRLSVSARGR
jgi:hypothetical protein